MTAISFLEFRSRTDPWMVWVVLGSCAVLLASCVLILLDDTAGPFSTGFTLVTAGIAVPVMLWFLMGTSYRLTETELLIRSGPLKKRIDLNNVTSVEPVRSIQSSPALSRDRFLIRYNQFDTVMISPQDRGQFLQEVAARATHLIWQEEKLVSIS